MPFASATPPKPCDDFYTMLCQLRSSNRALIAKLTSMALNHHPNYAREIVQIICRRMRELPGGDARVPLLHVIDSICQHAVKQNYDYPQRVQLELRPMLDSCVKRCSPFVRASLYRMWNMWQLKRLFHSQVLTDIETLFNDVMTEGERVAALAKRNNVSTAPSVLSGVARVMSDALSQEDDGRSPKRVTLNDPRIVPVDPRIVHRMAPTVLTTSTLPAHQVTTPGDSVQALVELRAVLHSPNVQQRPELRTLVCAIESDVSQAQTEEAKLSAVERAVQQLHVALTSSSHTPNAQTGTSTHPYPHAPSTHLAFPCAPMWTPPCAPEWMPPMCAPSLVQSTPLATSPQFARPSDILLVSGPTVSPLMSLPMVQQATFAAPVAAPALMPRFLPPPPRKVPTFSDDDLRNRNRVAVASLYEHIPFQCKTCGRRMVDQPAMAAHLDWHFKMKRRDNVIAKSNSTRSQGWHWEESEWIHADDVVFGVQGKHDLNHASNTGAVGTSSMSKAVAESLTSIAPEIVVADENQKACVRCGEAFETFWCDDEENWLYKDCMHITPLMVTKQATFTEGAGMIVSAHNSQSSTTDAHAAQLEERQLNQFRSQRLLEHLQHYTGRILHQQCHASLIQMSAISKPLVTNRLCLG